MPKTTYSIEFVRPNRALPMRTLAISDSAVSFGAFNASTEVVLITIAAADVRVRFDGTDPTALIGHLVEDGAWLVWTPAMASAAKFIRATGTDAEIYYSEMLVGAGT